MSFTSIDHVSNNEPMFYETTSNPMKLSKTSLLSRRHGPHCAKGFEGEHGGWSYEGILNNIDIGILILDLEGNKVVFRNQASHDILRDGDIPLNFDEIVDMFGIQKPQAENSGQPGEPHTIQLKQRLLDVSISPATERHVSLLIRDITEQARLESIAQAINSMDNLGFIFSGIRHEIGNPLNSLKMTITVLKNNLGRFPKANIEAYINRTLAEVSRMEYLLRSLKSFSMFEKADCQRLDITNFLEKFESLVSRDLLRNDIVLTLRIDHQTPPVQADPRGLHQVLLNLVANAADALTGCPEPYILIHVRQRDNLVWLYIEDNGCGMDQEQQKLLFQPFCTSKPDGNGLGLVITRKLLALMNGSIDITSVQGRGTCVAISLPILGSES